ncbi:MAG: polyribonucleotide nucleotidyltransferase [Bdellovibrionales bacterium CG10_big_fil_rev_8_21_14_0_10_45_34]|nr:MAG: polyribonucleotide nucleotidyltransferase [Bdellovibrionales bacterium CG10_big_fil_rev_8_21_14_0_10_45_34]
MKVTASCKVGSNEIVLETGRLAKQADGAVLATCGSNMVLATVVSSKRESTLDFFPLTVEFQEKFYSTGKIPGGYFKREGRPTEMATLSARLIDRPIRPKFPEGYRNETQIVLTVMSSDGLFPIDILASVAASAALHVSDIPFEGPTASVRVGRVNGEFIANLTPVQKETADLEIVLAGTRNGILMVEGEAKFAPEEDVLAALKFGHASLAPLFDAQDELRKLAGSVEKRKFKPAAVDKDMESKILQEVGSRVKDALTIQKKQERYAAFDAIKSSLEEKFLVGLNEWEVPPVKKAISTVLGDIKYQESRSMILSDKSRIDGRNLTQIRPISCEVGLLPRAHGSGLFTRGETQVLGTVTLGTGDDEQMVDALHGTINKRFLLHYNFPPYSVGETGRMGGQSRREIGHGYLAERALQAVLPEAEKFPYTIRVVSEVLECNGSSSMGTICSGTLALLDAGVPITGNVAGIAMGLIKEGSDVAVLSDILGDEDHLGDMDFKVAGTHEGITALQMDIKIDSVTFDIMEKALKQAHAGRLHILTEMEKVIKATRGELSPFAPRMETIKIKPEKVREVIGAGGKVIREIIATTGVKIDIEDNGFIKIFSSDPQAAKAAIQMIENICAEAEVGKVYEGKVKRIMDFGAFVEILPSTEGLLHISEIAHERLRSVTDVLNEGDTISVKVLDIDRTGRIKLSRKAILEA